MIFGKFLDQLPYLDEMLCGGEEKQNRSTSFDSSGKS
jgi:hypothetical protein